MIDAQEQIAHVVQAMKNKNIYNGGMNHGEKG